MSDPTCAYCGAKVLDGAWPDCCSGCITDEEIAAATYRRLMDRARLEYTRRVNPRRVK